ncbi:MAG: hypothetical protein M3R43_02075 [Acidobacteriota bacterium]|nr:hypothetical protein [Acidobacteriota bacterium]
MERQQGNIAVEAIPLYLGQGVREKAEQVSAQEGVSLVEFVSAAVTEKLDRLEHFNWARNRKTPTPESIAAALQLLRRPSSYPPDPEDELPEGWNPRSS